MKNVLKFIKKHILPTHLLARFVLIILLPMIVLQMMIAIFFYNRHWDSVSRQLASSVTGEIESVAEWVKSDPPEIEKNLKQISDILRMQFSWEANEKLPEPGKLRKSPASSDLRSALKGLPYPTQTWSEKDGKQQILLQLPKGLLQVLVPRKRFYSSTVIVFLIWMIVSSWEKMIFVHGWIRKGKHFGKHIIWKEISPDVIFEIFIIRKSFIRMRKLQL